MISIDEFKGKPDGTFTAQERVLWACFGMYEAPGVVLVAPVVYDVLGRPTELLTVTGAIDG